MRSKSIGAASIAKKKRGAAASATGSYVPRTALGRRLWRIRQRIIASGQPLFDWQALESELRDRRAEPNGEA